MHTTTASGSVAHPADTSAASARARFLEAVYDAAIELIGVLSPDGVVLDANRASLELVDVTLESVMGRPFWECPWWTHDERMAQRAREAVAEAGLGRLSRFEATHVDASGHVVHLDYSVRPIFNIQGNVEYLIPEGRDITARVAAEEDLAARKSRLRTIVDNTHDLIFLVRVEGPDIFRCESVNAAYLAVTGMSEAQVAGRLLDEVLPPDAAAFARARYREALEKGEPITYVENVQMPTRRLIVETRLTPVRDMSGDVTHLLGFCRDITAPSEMAAALADSEQRFRQALDASLDAFIVARPLRDDAGNVLDFELVDANARAATMVGRTRAELFGRRLYDVYPFSRDTQLFEQCSHVLATQQPFEIEQHAPFPDRPNRWVQRQIVPLGDQVAITSRDISDRKASQAAQAESELRFRTVIEGMREGVILRGRDAETRLWNPAAERILGVTADQVARESPASASWRAFYEDGTPWPPEQFPVTVALSTGRPQSARIMRLQRPDGTSLLLTVAAVPLLRDGETQPHAVVVTFSDITEQRALEERLRQAYKLEAVGQLAGGIAHDFNNVLTAIRGASEFLADVLPAGAPGREDIGIIQRATDRAAWLTRQLLSFGQRQVLQSRLTSLSEIVRQHVPEFLKDVPANITVRYDLQDNTRTVRVDERQLADAMRMLIVNAIDAMPTGGTLSVATRSARLESSEAAARGLQPGSYSVLAISDTGIGIDPSVREHLFEPFFTTKPYGERTGMSLAAVYGLVAQSQGFVDCDSARFVGTTFRLHFPEASDLITTVVPRDHGDADALLVGPADTAAAAARQQTVLVVDDEPVLREIARRMLARHGYATLGAASGAEAMTIIRADLSRISLVLTDLTMPGMRGHELALEARALRADMPVVLMSGFRITEEVRRIMGDNVLPFIAKPFSSEELADIVRQALEVAAV